MIKAGYILIESNSRFDHDCDNFIFVCDDKHIHKCIRKALKFYGCTKDAIDAYEKIMFEPNGHVLYNVYKKYDKINNRFDEDSVIDFLTLRIEAVVMNDVEKSRQCYT